MKAMKSVAAAITLLFCLFCLFCLFDYVDGPKIYAAAARTRTVCLVSKKHPALEGKPERCKRQTLDMGLRPGETGAASIQLPGPMGGIEPWLSGMFLPTSPLKKL